MRATITCECGKHRVEIANALPDRVFSLVYIDKAQVNFTNNESQLEATREAIMHIQSCKCGG